MLHGPLKVVYVTSDPRSSGFKQEEVLAFREAFPSIGGVAIDEIVSFDFRSEPWSQILSVDIEKMVCTGVARAYSQVRAPCIVEYAGLVFDKLPGTSYPGGLTKAMWNALGDDFVSVTGSAGLRATARAAVGFCNGLTIRSFVGETFGRIADSPRCGRRWYWDSVFIPDIGDQAGDRTYSEIVGDDRIGLIYKMKELSQSARAMHKFLEYLRDDAASGGLWA